MGKVYCYPRFWTVGLSAFILALMTYPKSGEEAVSKTLEERVDGRAGRKKCIKDALLYLKMY